VSAIVKCKVCGVRFDREKEGAVLVSARRYAHARCAENYQPSKEEQDIKDLHEYLKQLFGDSYNYIVLNKQIQTFIETNGYTHSGILKTLIYWYDIKQNSLDKAGNRIGIVPYVYQEAYDYYFDLYTANQLNANKDLTTYANQKVIEVTIKKPTRELPRFKLFDLDN